MPKSGKNICKRKDGWWEGRYAKGQFDGKNQCDYGFGCTYENDERKLNGVLDQFLNLPTFSSDTFEYLSKEWLAVKTPQLKISSVAKYTNILNLYLNPKFSKRHVSSILRSDVVMFCRELLVSGGVKSNGLAPKTVNSIISLMKNILDYASKEKGITVADLNDISVKQPQKPMRILSRGEQQKLSQYLCMHLTPCNLGILLCLYTGLRLGEICALKWNDVYISEQYIHIHQTMQRVQIQNDSASKTEVIIQSPKSDCSVRKIPIPILPKNTQVPAEMKNQYSTSVAYQETLAIEITQGEEEDLRYVTIIGTANIEILPREKLIPIEVTIACDENSIIHVRVVDLDLQRDLGEMHIDRVSNLSDEEVKQDAMRISKLDISGE